ncbi:MAG: type II toxin-antitoxin system RelE/ParE family toxin [Proteobacteria bacterium]|nr:type II toxin-antitoxin system RelE/ParE family toxin [Pseudomonadota bacterium]
MTYRLIYTADVEKSLRLIRAYIARDNSRIALHFIRTLRGRMKSLKTYAKRCPLAPENGRRGFEIRHLIYGNYRILFTITARTVTVLEIRHGARQPLA